MELLVIGAIIVLAGGIWFFNRDKGLDVNNDGKVDGKDFEAAVDNTVKGVVTEAKKAKAEVKAAVAKLPSLAKMKAQTKAQLEELGREFGIELDKRKTKDKMIDDLKSGVRAKNKEAKAQLK